MALKNNLHFFDKNGLRIGSSNSNSVFELTFEETSADLFSCQQINILEQVTNRLNNKIETTFNEPRELNAYLRIKFKNKSNKFFIYKSEYDSVLKDYIIKSTYIDEKLDLHSESTLNKEDFIINYQNDFLRDETVLQSGQISNNISKIVDEFVLNLKDIEYTENLEEINKNTAFLDDNGVKNYHIYEKSRNAISFDIGFTSRNEGEYTDTIEIYINVDDEESLLAEVTLFATCVEEDVRLTNILNIFGQNLDVNDSLVFRDSDVNEDLKDDTILNEKRKELILEYSNIIPYIGSYKGLLNALKFYGYDDLKIKEWWLNLSTNTHNLFEIDKDNFKTITNGSNVFGQNNNLKRTGKFSLFYNLFTLGELDRYGIPEVIPAFPYSNDEVLIKLYGLKNLLKNKYLPLSTRIVDITGEGIVFSRSSSDTWNTINEIQEVNKYDLEINVTAEKTFNLIDQIIKNEKNITKTSLKDLALEKLSSKRNLRITDLMQKYSYSDVDQYKSYSEVTIRDNTFNRKIKDYTDYIQDVENIPLYILESFPVYEVEYTFYTKNGKGNKIIKRGKPSDLKTFKLQIDVAGNYSAIIKMYDIYGNVNLKRIDNMFTVELPEPLFGVNYKDIIRYKTILDAQKLKVKDSFINAINQDVPNLKIKDFERCTIDALNISNYFNQDKYNNCYFVDIKEVNRDDRYVIIDKSNIKNVTDVYLQNFLNFQRVNEKEIKPISIKEIDHINNKIYLNSKEAPLVKDTLEIFEYLELEEVTIEDNNWIEISSILNIRDDFYLYLYNSSNEDVAYLEVEEYSIDSYNSTTKLRVKDPDGLLETEFNTYFIIKDRISIDVESVEKDSNGLTVLNVTSTVDLNLEYQNAKIESGLSLSCWWNVFTGEYGIPIIDIIETSDEIKIILEDNENELFSLNSKFKAIFSSFDIKNLENVNIKSYTIKQLEKAKILDIERKTLDSFENISSVRSGFVITNWNNGGKIKINDSDWFQFSSSCSNDIEASILELNSTKINEFKKYNFFKFGNDIKAVCKTYGFETLDIIEFSNGLDIYPKLNPRYACTYQLPPVINQEVNFSENSTNNRMMWNNLIRDWVYVDETAFIEKTKMSKYEWLQDDEIANFRIALSTSMNNGFRITNIKSSFDPIYIKTYTQCFFFSDSSKDIIGKKKFIWTIYKDANEICKIENKFFSYMFKEVGSYDIKVQVIDWNGNSSESIKYNFINVSY